MADTARIHLHREGLDKLNPKLTGPREHPTPQCGHMA